MTDTKNPADPDPDPDPDSENGSGSGRGSQEQTAADARSVYGIAVAAELTGTGVQNLRAYEKRGLLEPARTDGGTRRYSVNDLHRLRRIGRLLAEGLNLAGVARVLDLEDDNDQLRQELHHASADAQAHPARTRGRST